MKKKLCFIAALFMISVFAAKAQDLIYKKNKEIILAKILEIGVDEIKYKEFNNQDGPTMAIDKNEVAKIKYENGKEVIISNDNFTNPDQYADNKKNAIKVDFLAPMFGQFTVGYERSLKPGASFEVQLGIIGWGVQNYEATDNNITNFGVTADGAFLRVGYKFIRTPDYYTKGMRYAHILKGSYIRPELTYGACVEHLSYFTYNGATTTPAGNKSKNVQFGAIMLNFGKQWIMNDIFLVDYFIGIGYGFSSKKDDTDYTSGSGYSINNHAMIGPGYSSPFAFNAGLKVGILIK